MHLLLIAVFGMAGVLSRYGMDRLVGSFWNKDWPLGTFVINLFGAFLAGVIFVAATQRAWSEDMRVALMVGFLGGFTTFSAFSLQSWALWEGGDRGMAVTYLFLSPVLGLAFATLGVWVGRHWT